eukprot:469047-Pelagomonas_calceolata.AAC.2
MCWAAQIHPHLSFQVFMTPVIPVCSPTPHGARRAIWAPGTISEHTPPGAPWHLYKAASCAGLFVAYVKPGERGADWQL